MWIDQPRVRSDGCFIAVQVYTRRGASETAWVSPSHTVTYFRYLRFFSDGRVISLVSTLTPAEVVRALDFNLRIKGLAFGRWKLQPGGDVVSVWELEDPTMPEERRTSFLLNVRLRSTTRGRMNKLEILDMATFSRRTREVQLLPLLSEHSRPFFFSPVRSYEA